jgi:hypothetical protein
MVVPIWPGLELRQGVLSLLESSPDAIFVLPVLGTFYISSCVCLFVPTYAQVPNPLTFKQRFRVPNIILAFIPAEIHPDTLNTMTAFAVSIQY